jgi:hypothetical protein
MTRAFIGYTAVFSFNPFAVILFADLPAGADPGKPPS